MAETNYLKNFVAGEKIKATEINDNNQFLLDKIGDNATTVQQYVAMQISNLTSQLASTRKGLAENLETQKETLNSLFADNALYITTYRNGTSWAREYFSDAEKTNRVWLEQGFLTPVVRWGDNNCKTYNLVKAFKENNYTVVVSSTCAYVGSGVSSGNVNVEWTSTTQIGIGNDAGNTFGVRVYACGY